MLKNFFKTATRNLSKHKGFSFINIAGLTLGLTACLLIGLFVWDEKQYDQFIPAGDRVYRAYDQDFRKEGTILTPRTPPMMATTLQQQFPEVEKTLRIMDMQSKSLFETGDKRFYEEGGLAAEPSFFDIFPLSLQYGSYSGLLNDPNSIVISQNMAQKYFGNTDPVGKQIMVNKDPYVVKGVLKNDGQKFHLKITYIIPMVRFLKDSQVPETLMHSWGWQQFYTYIKLKPGTDINQLQAKFQQYFIKNAEPQLKIDGTKYLSFFQPLKNIHLYSSDFKMDIAQKGNISYVRALTIIALFILLIACFNFVNLATAKSLQRAKEVGVRKSIGASRLQLILQFTGETVLLGFVSTILAVGLTLILLPVLNQFTEKHISYSLFYNPLLILLLIALAFLTGLLAGIYPALVLSGFQPVKVLKGSISEAGAGSKTLLRHVFAVMQFSLSALLIICAIVVYRQVDYLHNKNLGFNKDQLLFFPIHSDNMLKNYQSFKNDLAQSTGVTSVSIGYGFPGDIFATDQIIANHNGEQKAYSTAQLMVDEDYIKTLGLQIIAGRDFSKDIKTDKDQAFIINETGVKELGYGNAKNAIGQPVAWKVWNNKNLDTLKKGQIIGVVKDFHFKSLFDKMSPAVLQIYPPAYWKVAVKIKGSNIPATINYVKGIWNKYSPEFPFEYKFMDENFDQMYKAEDKLKTLLTIFTGVAIFVGCLGLFGLAAYTAERRTKEIGIRKVLGASVNGLVVMLSGDFVKLVLIALVIASPIAWFLMSRWLQDFAYRVSISWWMFALAGCLSITIALLTVSYQALRAALTNPVKSLRTE